MADIVISNSEITRHAVTTIWGIGNSETIELGSYDINTRVSTTGTALAGTVIEKSGQQLGIEPARFTVVTTTATVCGTGALASKTIEEGTTETAIGNGLTRSETISTSLDAAMDFTSTPGSYGFAASSRLNYTMMYLADGVKFINQGWTNSTRAISLTGC